ncbi:MAG: hypothetical protein FWD11_12420, partial [Micrococcales bacterium]|nr:hypothetical protein [Micrococcales bacterium]
MRVVRELGTLLRTVGFRRLFTVRVVSQAGDGVFQVGLATLFFFSPERMTTAGGVAAGFAVLLLPFTLVGPFAGPLLDRWRRRQVLVVANLVRMVLTGVLAAVIAATGVSLGVYVLALVVLGVNRFLLSALSAGQPLVVPTPLLLTANSLTPTLGAVAAATGAAVGFVAGRALPAGTPRHGWTLVAAAVMFGVASALALRLGADQLGPHRPKPGEPADTQRTDRSHSGTPDQVTTDGALGCQSRSGTPGREDTWANPVDGAPQPADRSTTPWRTLAADLGSTWTDLVAAGRYLVARRTPGAAIAMMGVQRFVYGVNFLALVLLSRNWLSDPSDADAGLATFATLLAVSFVGNGLAVLITPVVHTEPARWVAGCVVIGAVGQGLLAT